MNVCETCNTLVMEVTQPGMFSSVWVHVVDSPASEHRISPRTAKKIGAVQVSSWVKVTGDVAKKAAELLSTAGSTSVLTRFPLDLPSDLVKGFIEYLSEDLGCDHSVNVCSCNAAEVAWELKLALDGRQVCPKCDGEGFQDDEDGRPATCQSCFTSGICAIEGGDDE